jgi:hypothetical protein
LRKLTQENGSNAMDRLNERGGVMKHEPVDLFQRGAKPITASFCTL